MQETEEGNLATLGEGAGVTGVKLGGPGGEKNAASGTAPEMVHLETS